MSRFSEVSRLTFSRTGKVDRMLSVLGNVGLVVFKSAKTERMQESCCFEPSQRVGPFRGRYLCTPNKLCVEVHCRKPVLTYMYVLWQSCKTGCLMHRLIC